jgi:steroid delta-isomerase-like uncharacterized protein
MVAAAMDHPAPNPSETEAQARALFSALFDDRDFATVRQFWTPRSVDHFLAAGISPTGPDELEAFFRGMLDAIPDFDLQIENVVANGRQVVVQWHAHGNFTGTPFLGIEATGRYIEMRGVDVIVLDEDGKLDTNTVYYDGAEFARQVGLLPKMGSAADRALMWSFNAKTKLARSFGRSR